MKTRKEATIVNALIRCIRMDDMPLPVFDLVRRYPGLWVFELDSDAADAGKSQMDFITDQIEREVALLTTLQQGSSDFTLHLAIVADEIRPLRIPWRLSLLAGKCGLGIEIHYSEGQD